MARTDSEKTPAMRLNALRREWGLSAVDEATAQAQNKALEPLSKWLREGTDSPKVVIRAVQLLLADPELTGVDKRPAVETVIHQVSELWANAGVETQGMFGLQAMLLAAWPYDLNRGGFALTPSCSRLQEPGGTRRSSMSSAPPCRPAWMQQCAWRPSSC